MPTLQQLRYLVSLAETLSFSRSAEILHVSQPALSMQIRTLEARLGTVLFERNRARVLLTPTGADLAQRAQQVLREVEDLRKAAQEGTRPGLHGILRLGVVHSVGAYLMSVGMPELRQNRPDLRLYMREDNRAALLKQLADGRHDALILPGRIDQPELETALLLQESLQIVLPADHPLAAQEVIAPADMQGQTVLAMEPGHQLQEPVAELCRNTGAILAHDYEGTTLDTLRQMVASGLGITFLPSLYIRSEVMRETLVVARRMAEPFTPRRDIVMVWRASSPQRRNLLLLAQQIAQTVAAIDLDAPRPRRGSGAASA